MTDKFTSENFLSPNKSNNDIDLGKIFRFLLMQSKLIIFSVLAVFILSFAYYSQATKTYNIKSLIQYEAFDQNVFDPSQALYAVSGSSSSDISNMIQLYESRTNYLKVIEDLKLNISIKGLEEGEHIDIDINAAESDLLKTQNLTFSFSENGYSLIDDNLNEIKTSKYGQTMILNDLSILVKSSSLREYRPINVFYRNPESMYKSFKTRMNVSTSTASRNRFFATEEYIFRKLFQFLQKFQQLKLIRFRV